MNKIPTLADAIAVENRLHPEYTEVNRLYAFSLPVASGIHVTLGMCLEAQERLESGSQHQLLLMLELFGGKDKFEKILAEWERQKCYK